MRAGTSSLGSSAGGTPYWAPPAWGAPRASAPFVAAPQAEDTATVPRPAGIYVNRVWHKTRTVADIMPGDIGFYYKKKGCGMKQKLIALGQRFINASQPAHRGDADVLHGYIVLQSFPKLNRLLVADAASGSGDAMGADAIFIDFSGRDNDPFDVDSYHLYYRFNEPRLRQRVADRAQAWSRHHVANFNMLHALAAPMRSKGLFSWARRRVRHLVAESPFDKPVPDMGGKNFYEVMCTEFVASVCIPEIISLFCADHGIRNSDSSFARSSLRRGAVGQVFDCDPRWLVPSSLQTRLLNSSQVQMVGCVPPAIVTPDGPTTPPKLAANRLPKRPALHSVAVRTANRHGKFQPARN